MENKNTGERSPLMIIGGLVAIIVITLGVLGLFAIQQRPVEVANNAPAADAAAAVSAAASTPVSESAAVTETTTTAAISDTATSAVTTTVAAVVTDTATTAVTNTASAAVTTTAAVSGTAAPVTTTAPVSAAAAVAATAPVSAAAPAAAAGPIDMAAVTAAVTKGTCGACHTIPGIDTAVGMIGPALATIGTDAGTRVAGTTAEAYLRESILNPNAFIAPKCPTGDCLPGLMLPNLADILTPAEIDLIISYLLTLK